MNRENLSSEDFNYDLPEERIAKHPAANRNQSKILTYKKGQLGEDVFSNLASHLPKNSSLVFNDSKVIAARLRFKTEHGANVELFCLEPYKNTVEQSLSAQKSCQWQCMVGNLKRFKSELKLAIAGTQLIAKLIEKRNKNIIVEFNWDGTIPFSDILEEAGEIPLPPYLNRETEEEDKLNYQTIYAKQDGAVAAPTAGLHFTIPQLKNLQEQGHNLAYLTLYVGAGTFRPVKAKHLTEHEMHEERIVVNRSTVEQLLKNEKNIIAVGTTSLRSLESLYWLAVKRWHLKDQTIDFISQVDAYQLQSEWTWKEAFRYLLEDMIKKGEQQIDFHSALFIMPSYEWKVISGLITNFHQPKSTLLALVSAWIGEDWKKVYDYALSHDFRFLSYGDSSLLLK